jgi:hypothetical protein
VRRQYLTWFIQLYAVEIVCELPITGNFAACYTRQSVFYVTAGKIFLCCLRHLQLQELTLSRHRTEVWFDPRNNALISDSLLSYPDLLTNVYDLLAILLQLGDDFRQMARTPKTHSIRLEVRKESNHAIPIHFLTFCNQKDLLL